MQSRRRRTRIRSQETIAKGEGNLAKMGHQGPRQAKLDMRPGGQRGLARANGEAEARKGQTPWTASVRGCRGGLGGAPGQQQRQNQATSGVGRRDLLAGEGLRSRQRVVTDN